MPGDIKILFGKNVRELREKRGLSQAAFSDRVGIDRSYISGIERGVRNPTLTMISRMAECLSVPTRDLLPPK